MADVFEFENELFLILVDHYSKWIEAVHMSDPTSKSVISVMKSVFASLSKPTTLYSDNGMCFVSTEFEKFVESWHLSHMINSSNQRFDRLIRWGVGTVKKMWSNASDKEWALMAYRSSPLKYTTYSPGELMFGRALRVPVKNI